MTCHKNEKRGTWYVGFRCKDWRGEPKRKTKRGFRTKRETAAWEASFKRSMEGVASMSFENACVVYLDEIGPRLRGSSLASKRMMLECRIIPYFTGLAVGEITALHVMEWCSWLAGETERFVKPLSSSYLNTLRSQLSAVFNHLVRYHGLASNPVNMTLSFEGSEEDACDVWTVEEYLSFSSVVAGKPQVHIAFEILFWCGLRRGEMLALTYGDVDLGKGILRVSKSLSKVGNRDVVGPPKTGSRTGRSPCRSSWSRSWASISRGTGAHRPATGSFRRSPPPFVANSGGGFDYEYLENRR